MFCCIGILGLFVGLCFRTQEFGLLFSSKMVLTVAMFLHNLDG